MWNVGKGDINVGSKPQFNQTIAKFTNFNEIVTKSTLNVGNRCQIKKQNLNSPQVQVKCWN